MIHYGTYCTVIHLQELEKSGPKAFNEISLRPTQRAKTAKGHLSTPGKQQLSIPAFTALC